MERDDGGDYNPYCTREKGCVMPELYDYLWKVISTPFLRAGANPVWELIGFVGQGVFFGRFIIQWIASERKKRTVIPVAFWYLSLIGGLITLLYSIHVGRLVFILAFSLNTVIYVRNLMIYYRRRADRRGLVFAAMPVATDDSTGGADDEVTP
jgi:lipid-A-disaccharide synthase-like uncharacterized protein